MDEKVFIGVSGWSYPDWAGVVYPERRPGRFSELACLAGYLDAVEINTSFYRPPAARMAARWVEQASANPRFLFTAKLWQRFTHERNEPWTAAEARQVKDGMQPLREAGKLAALLLQFPWSFPATGANTDWLGRLAEEFREFPCVVEVRHASWDTDEARKLLTSSSLNFCNIDQPHSRSSIGMTNIATGPVAYYRFHGRNAHAWYSKDAGRDERYNYLYTERELAPWVENIRDMAERAQQIFVMNNNHYQGQAVVNALQIKASLSGRRVPAPESLIERYPVLRAIAAPPRGQGNLPFRNPRSKIPNPK